MTQSQSAQIQIVKAIADAIKELGSVPSGHLYAQLMGKLSLENYNKVIGALKGANLIEEKSNLLIWKA